MQSLQKFYKEQEGKNDEDLDVVNELDNMELKPLPKLAETLKSVSDNTAEDFFKTNNEGPTPFKLQRSNTMQQHNKTSEHVGRRNTLANVDLNNHPVPLQVQTQENHLLNIMVYCKPYDDNVINSFSQLFKHISETYEQVIVLTDDWVIKELQKNDLNTHNGKEQVGMKMKCRKELIHFQNQNEQERKKIDYIITLGGDGTILWASKQFAGNYIPPMICFAHGSLGFLCNYKFDEYKEVIANTLNHQTQLHLDTRMRLKVNVGPDNMRKIFRGNELEKFSLEKVEDFHVMNEIVLDRGPSPYSVQLDIYFDGNKMTHLLGDGLIISTPTGSTAYNMSAGGSIVQPNTQCICITPLAPHSLSFRPLIVPISVNITIKKPMDNRNSAWVALDGGTRFELKQGEEINVCGSTSNIGMVIAPTDNLTDLWSQRLAKQLGWNQRDELKPLEKKQK